MQLFDLSEAAHFCQQFTAVPGAAAGSLDGYERAHLSAKSVLTEGTSEFQAYQACLLRDVERNLLLSASHYRRSLDLMMASASSWGHVTLYYGSFFAARALLGMLGCRVMSRKVVDVAKGNPGSQSLRLRKIGNGLGEEPPSSYSGSHQKFWDLFYRAVASLRPQVTSAHAAVLLPVSGNPAWMIEKRNLINYDSYEALSLAGSFAAGFSKASFPTGLPGPMSTQWTITEGLLILAVELANSFRLATDAATAVGMAAKRSKAIKESIYHARPAGLVGRTKKREVTKQGP